MIKESIQNTHAHKKKKKRKEKKMLKLIVQLRKTDHHAHAEIALSQKRML